MADGKNANVPAVAAALVLSLAACPGRDWTPESVREPLPGTSSSAQPHAGAPPIAASKPVAAASAASSGARDYARRVSVILEASSPGAPAGSIAFALPLPRGVSKSLDELDVEVGGKHPEFSARPLLVDHAPDGTPLGLRSVLIELPPGSISALPAPVTISFGRNGRKPRAVKLSKLDFASRSRPVDVKVPTATYGVESRGSSLAAVPRTRGEKLLFASVEPRVVANLPPGYLAATGILGDLMTASDLAARPDLAGMAFLSDAFGHFVDGAMGETGYPLQPAAVGLETEAWLYDRCATYLLAYAHAGDAKRLRHGLRTCARYARDIDLEGERRGIYRGKKERDLKYSHVRGLYVYYALTGDEAALEAGRAMADMWNEDPQFVIPYRAGSVRAADKLWTERLLAASIEGGIYGFALTGDARHLASARALVKVALRHITTSDAADLRAITKTPFPPQSCFIHNALQQAEGNEGEPWCSSWMSELVIDPVLRYVELTGDREPEEILVRLARSMRDAGTSYFQKNPLKDSFLAPSRPFSTGEDPRILVPLYGYGIDDKGVRRDEGEWSDFEHCPDASAITAAAMMVLRRRGGWDSPPVPASSRLRVDLSRFSSEGASLLALHHELAYCAAQTLKNASREKRDPGRAPPGVLAAAANGDATAQEKALADSKIGWPVYETSPGRKLSWWFNTSIAQLAWLSSAKVAITDLAPGAINPR